MSCVTTSGAPGMLHHVTCSPETADRSGSHRLEAVAAGDAPAGVGLTALAMARVRAEESRRTDRLFDDPYAAAFVAAAPGALPEDRGASGDLAWMGAVFAFHGVIRTRFFDDCLLAACAAGCRQVVLLAAGLDTRAFRLSWPDGGRPVCSPRSARCPPRVAGSRSSTGAWRTRP